MTEPNGICPCCGNGLNIGQGVAFHADSHTLVSSDFAIVLSGNEAKLFALLWSNRNSGRPLTKQVAFDHLYALDPNGGPDPKIIDVLLHGIRKQLAETNLEIINIQNAGWVLRGKSARASKRIDKRASSERAAA